MIIRYPSCLNWNSLPRHTYPMNATDVTNLPCYKQQAALHSLTAQHGHPVCLSLFYSQDSLGFEMTGDDGSFPQYTSSLLPRQFTSSVCVPFDYLCFMLSFKRKSCRFSPTEIKDLLIYGWLTLLRSSSI